MAGEGAGDVDLSQELLRGDTACLRISSDAVWLGGRVFGAAMSIDDIGLIELNHPTKEWTGRLLVLTTFRDRAFEVEPREMVFKESAVIASRYAWRSEVLHAAELVARGDVQPVIGETVAPDQVLDLHARLEKGDLLGRGALTWRAEHDA
jgi:hypothetical protein